MIRYTQEERAFLSEYIPGHSYADIRDEFSRRFRPITLEQVRSYLKNNKMPTGRGGYFQKGNVPWNNGKHYNAGGRSAETRFKKGHIPTQHRPVGSTRVNRDGYLEIKIREPNRWAAVHRLVWEKEHGRIPKGHIVVFKDGDRQNLAPENLACISRSTHARLNQNHLSGSGEWFDAALMTVQLMELRRKVRKGKST